jgi:hypothetical protein
VTKRIRLGHGIMHFCGTQRRKLAQDFLHRQSAGSPVRWS